MSDGGSAGQYYDWERAAYELFIEHQPALWEWLKNRPPPVVESLVDLQQTLPDVLNPIGFSHTEPWKNDTIKVSAPKNIDISERVFPVLAIVSEEILTSFGLSVFHTRSIERSIFGEEFDHVGSLPTYIELFVKTRESSYKQYALLNLLTDDRVDKNMMRQWTMRLGALRLSELISSYDFVVSFETQCRRVLRNPRTLDSLGNRNWNVISSEVLQIAKRNGRQLSHQNLIDVFYFCCREELESSGAPKTWDEFENHCLSRLQELGFAAELTPVGRDFGADIIAVKGSLTIAIQCKAYADPVGVKAVQEVVASLPIYSADFGAVVSASGFTSAARELAESHSVALLTTETITSIDGYWRR